MHYDARTGSTRPFNLWKLATLGFMLLSAVLVLIALHCAKPLHCDDEIYYPTDKSMVCEINER